MIKGCKKYIICEMGFTQWGLYAVAWTHAFFLYKWNMQVQNINTKSTLIWASSIFGQQLGQSLEMTNLLV